MHTSALLLLHLPEGPSHTLLPLDGALYDCAGVNNSIFGNPMSKTSPMNTADVHSGWLPSMCIWEVIYWLLADLGEGNGEARGAKGSLLSCFFF